MINSVLNLIWRCVDNGIDFLSNVYDAVGIPFEALFFSLVLVGAVMKFIISPYVTGSSDPAKRLKKGAGKDD